MGKLETVHFELNKALQSGLDQLTIYSRDAFQYSGTGVKKCIWRPFCINKLYAKFSKAVFLVSMIRFHLFFIALHAYIGHHSNLKKINCVAVNCCRKQTLVVFEIAPLVASTKIVILNTSTIRANISLLIIFVPCNDTFLQNAQKDVMKFKHENP